MNCLKCGRKIENSGVFCDRCLEVMAKYPVKDNVRLQLPRRKDEALPKKSAKKKHQVNLEESVRQQKRQIRRLLMIVWVLFLAVCLLVGWLVYEMILKPETGEDNLGKNYSTVEPGGK